MPLLQICKVNANTYLGFWEITEAPEALRQTLEKVADNRQEIPAYTNTTRQSQWLGSRILVYTLLQQFTQAPVLLQTNALGKPVFESDAFHVSISHCQKLVAVILSDRYEVGIDIEFISPKVMRVTDKFMADAEKTDAGEDLEKTLIYWSTKETLYKLYSKKQLVFKEQILIDPFKSDQHGTLTARMITSDFEKDYSVHYEKINNYILTYCIG